MAAPRVLQTDVDLLLQSGKLSVSGRVSWRHGDHKSWAKAEVQVAIDDPLVHVNLRIVISASLIQDKRDYVLLWNNIPVRRLCINGSHTNRHTNSERWLRQTHKHTLTDHCLDRFVYTPTDITATDAHGEFTQFCAECGIVCSATVADLPDVQREMIDDM